MQLVFAMPAGAQLADNNLPYQNIGVISVVAKDFRQSYVGLTVFNNHMESNDISDWKVDDGYEDQVSKIINDETNYKAEPIHGAKATLFRVNDTEGLWKSRNPQWGEIASELRSMAAERHLDAFVVIAGTYINDNTQASYPGVGVYAWRRESILYINAEIALIDGKSGKVVATNKLGMGKPKHGILSLDISMAPRTTLPGYFAKKAFGELDSDSLKACRNELIELPVRAWPITLHYLFSTNKNASK
jgi:hypothetical protein